MPPLRTPDNIRLEYELTHCELEKHRDTWLDARHRYNRSGGLDSHLSEYWGLINRHMDELLERFHTRVGQLAVMGISYDEALLLPRVETANVEKACE